MINSKLLIIAGVGHIGPDPVLSRALIRTAASCRWTRSLIKHQGLLSQGFEVDPHLVWY
jgi:hypothetical protein